MQKSLRMSAATTLVIAIGTAGAMAEVTSVRSGGPAETVLPLDRTAVEWNHSVIDDGNGWLPSDPEKITIPAWATRARCSARVEIGFLPPGGPSFLRLAFLRNGLNVPFDLPPANGFPTSQGNWAVEQSGPWWPVPPTPPGFLVEVVVTVFMDVQGAVIAGGYFECEYE